MRKAPFLALSFGLPLVAACAGAPKTTTPLQENPVDAPAPVELNWGELDAEAFEQARVQGKLILVDAGIEGCTACRHQHEITYQNPRVQARLANDYILVAVDADQQPDLGHVFRPWGWPATVFLNDDGEIVHAVAGSRMPKRFLAELDTAQEKKKAHGKAAARSQSRAPSDLMDLCTKAYRKLDRIADPHGWGAGMRFVSRAPVEYAIFRSEIYNEESRLERVEEVATGYAKLIDSVWGGVFIAARNSDYSGEIPEKRLIHEADALWTFAAQYQLTGEAAWEKAALDVDRYLKGFLGAEDGTFYSTQQDEPPGGLPSKMSTKDYFALDDEGRRQLGVPRVDTESYTNENGRVILAYLKLYQATGSPQALETAEKAAHAIIETRSLADGALAQTSSSPQDDERRFRSISRDDNTRLFLGAQVRMGLAFLELHQATGKPLYLERARRLAQVTLRLEDNAGPEPAHGFFSTTAREFDAQLPRPKPLGANLNAARLFSALSGYATSEEERNKLITVAERTLQYAANPPANRMRGPGSIALTALALESLIVGPSLVVLSGAEPDSSRTSEFRRVAYRNKKPLQLLKFKSQDDTQADLPSVSLCSGTECSQPIHSANELKAALASRVPRAKNGGCQLVRASD